MFERMVNFALRKPKVIFGAALLLTALACLQFFKIKIDTDPENMLSEKEFVRVFHKEVKKEFSLHDYIVLGVVDEQNEQGVFNPSTLEKVYGITRKIKNIDGVAAYELMSLGNKDDIQQAGPGEVSFRWLMGKPPYSSEDAARIRERALANPLFYNTLISQDAKALCIYVPIKEKSLSYKVSLAIQGVLKQYGAGEERYYLAGLPLAEDAFGKEMFVQMGICAPLAILVIFLLMYWFFRNFVLVLVPILMAADVVLLTMGLMVGLGFPIHIMSSMIPIFLLPVCVLDSIHILSDFFEEYKKTHDKNKTVSGVLKMLFIPNLFTSITTIAGFFSLSFAPIPPIQVFGIFVAAGVAIAWFTTVFFIPAYIAVLKEKHLEGFGATHEELSAGLLSRFLVGMGRLTVRRWKAFLLLAVAVTALSVYGITRIRVNDNPTKWFARRHPIRIADTVLNRHFGGTYSVYLILGAQDKEGQVFKEPAMLSYIKKMQDYLYGRGQVGKSTSLADVVMKVYCELMGGRKTYYAIPDTRPAVAQCLLSFENSHKPDDLFHFVTPDYSKANLWLQLKSGDNQVMAQVKRDTERFIKNNPPPYPVSFNWSGLTYINMVWQDKMVLGMLWNFIGSFIIVLLMMIMLLRSVLAALVCMVPLTVTVLFIYGFLGLTGKEYDMPVAVLSALTLGLAVDFAIHFTERAKAIYAAKGNWKDASEEMFLTSYRAILRNALVVSIGFLPLFISPLVPYNTVGLFMFAIMLFASAGTLVILPAIVSMHPGVIFYEPKPGFLRSCPQCLLMSLVISGGVAYLLVAYTSTAWNVATVIALASVILLSVLCSFVSRVKGCLFPRKPNREG